MTASDPYTTGAEHHADGRDTPLMVPTALPISALREQAANVLAVYASDEIMRGVLRQEWDALARAIEALGKMPEAPVVMMPSACPVPGCTNPQYGLSPESCPIHHWTDRERCWHCGTTVTAAANVHYDRYPAHAESCPVRRRDPRDFELGNPDSEQHCLSCHCTCSTGYDYPNCGHTFGCPGC